MATPYVTADEVREILMTSLGDTAIDAYSNAARLTIDSILGSSSLSEATLKEIIRWFTAHLIASTQERQIKTDATGQAKVEYDSKVGLGLDFTSYGQQCKIFDTTGLLAAAGKRKASVYAVTSFDEETV